MVRPSREDKGRSAETPSKDCMQHGSGIGVEPRRLGSIVVVSGVVKRVEVAPAVPSIKAMLIKLMTASFMCRACINR